MCLNCSYRGARRTRKSDKIWRSIPHLIQIMQKRVRHNLEKNGKSPLRDCSCVEIPWSCAEMSDFLKHSSAFHLIWWNSSSYHFCCPGLLVPFLAGQYRRWVFSRGDGFHRNSPSGVHSCCRPSSIFNHAFLKSTL